MLAIEERQEKTKVSFRRADRITKYALTAVATRKGKMRSEEYLERGMWQPESKKEIAAKTGR